MCTCMCMCMSRMLSISLSKIELRMGECTTSANLRTKILDVRGFDSSTILSLRGGIPRPMKDFPEWLSQAIFVGSIHNMGIWNTISPTIVVYQIQNKKQENNIRINETKRVMLQKNNKLCCHRESLVCLFWMGGMHRCPDAGGDARCRWKKRNKTNTKRNLYVKKKNADMKIKKNK